MALACPLTLLITYWIANRPERHPEAAPGETELEFDEREGLSFRLSYEYVAEFLYELREKFERGWSTNQVAMLLTNVVDRRRAAWSAGYVVRREGVSDELSLRFCQMDRDSVLCCLEVPKPFLRAVRGVVAHYPAKMV